MDRLGLPAADPAPSTRDTAGARAPAHESATRFLGATAGEEGAARALLARAAQPSLERIRADRARAPERLRPLLAHLEAHLFQPGLDVNKLKRVCGIRDNSAPLQFHAALGRPPHAYMEDRRLETAARLLAGTDVKIWRIAALIGYSSIQVFSRAFHRWSERRPSVYRAENAGQVRREAVEEELRRRPPAERWHLLRSGVRLLDDELLGAFVAAAPAGSPSGPRSAVGVARLAAVASALASLAGDADPWAAGLGVVALARLALRLGDAAEARRLLAQQAALLRELQLPVSAGLGDVADLEPAVLGRRLAAAEAALLDRFPGWLS